MSPFYSGLLLGAAIGFTVGAVFVYAALGLAAHRAGLLDHPPRLR